MSTPDFIAKQLPERQALLTQLHEVILKEDKTVKATIELMMRQEMIIYKAGGGFKYGLASVKKYMSLHVLPMYGSPPEIKGRQMIWLSENQRSLLIV